MIRNLARIFYDPTGAFADIFADRRNHALIPLAVCLFCSALLLYLYYGYVNFGWLVDWMYVGYTDQQKRVLAGLMSKRNMQAFGLAGVLVIVPVLDLLLAIYFVLVTKLQGSNRRFGECFRLVCWAALPVVLLLPAGLITMYLTPSGRLFPEDLNPASLNNLVFHVTRPNPYLTLLSNLNLITIWQIVLMVIGLRQLTGMPTRSAAAIVCAPYLLIYGGWLLILAIGHIK
ncbi:Yip1 family protein [Sphingomonas crusticola]|uniref:Yip1 family protein n=1 Tax=Sphingomonas crusticola TaxID=1697973 RepID=UPI000E26B479|nr:Yip1 family protein [Sphingomonas crusticola]